MIERGRSFPERRETEHITESTHGDCYTSLTPNTPREISIDDHSNAANYNLKIFLSSISNDNEKRGTLTSRNTMCNYSRDELDTRREISIDDRSISSLFSMTRRGSRSRDGGLKVEDGAATETEGRKEECHATDPYRSR